MLLFFLWLSLYLLFGYLAMTTRRAIPWEGGYQIGMTANLLGQTFICEESRWDSSYFVIIAAIVAVRGSLGLVTPSISDEIPWDSSQNVLVLLASAPMCCVLGGAKHL